MKRAHAFFLHSLLFLFFILEGAIALASLLECITIATGIAALLPAALLTIVLLVAAALHLLPIARFDLCIFLHHIDDLVRNSQILDGAAPDVAFRHTPKFIAILQRTNKKKKQHKCAMGFV